MAYITLKELKEILPEIMRDWIDKDDEGWDWIFQEIEQKCCVGKRLKGKKWKKKLQSMVDTHSTVLSAHRNDINKLESLLKGNIDNVTQLGLTMKDLGAEIRHLRNDITAAKSMAETAKQRTEVDYSKYKQPISYGLWSDCKRVIETCGRYGATKEELKQLDLIMSKYIRNPSKTTEPVESCTTCKYYRGDGVIKEPCITCNAYEHWEAKENE